MSKNLEPLASRMAGFERRLRLAWSSAVPQVPQHLQHYRQNWLDNLQAPLTGATLEELQRAIRRAKLIVVSDYHPLERSRTGLADIISAVPTQERVALVLELLPLGTTLTPAEALRGVGPNLITGQSLLEAYRPALEILAQRRAAIVGAWIDGSAQRRDGVAAEVWERINRQGNRSRVIFHFGDWHLAPQHLPARLANSGVKPLVIHQSPEPVWEHVGANPLDHTFRTHSQQWVWLQTPPLSLWANLYQDLADCDGELLAEAAEHLCESAALLLAKTLELPTPSCRLTVLPSSCWEEFVATLPRHRAAAFSPHFPPLHTIFHPSKPLAWSPRMLDLGDLIQGAAHSLICDSALAYEVGFLGSMQRNCFRFLCAHLVNPFLRIAPPAKICDKLWPEQKLRTSKDDLLKSAATLTWTDASRQDLAPELEVFLERTWGQLAGSNLAGEKGLSAATMKKLLDLDSRVFDWEALTATIRVA